MSAGGDAAREQMTHAVEHLQREFGRVRTGRASASLLEPISVEYYGTPTPLNQIAAIAVPEARMLTVTPYDASALTDIERAIQKSDLGITPNSDGKLIRLVLPELTGERRKELVKQVRQMAEETRVSIRNARRHANELLKQAKKDGDLSEDAMHTDQHGVQELTDDFIKQIDDLVAKKEAEITEV